MSSAVPQRLASVPSRESRTSIAMVSSRVSVPLSCGLFPALTGLAVSAAAVLSACGGSSSGGGQSGIPGNVEQRPGGGFFIVDPNQSGGAARLHLVQVNWGRLVDVHEVDANGNTVAAPAYRDFLIEENIQTTIPDPPGTPPAYVLGRDPITQRERLIVGRQNDPDDMDDAFDRLVRQASDNLPTVSPKNDDGSSAPPFTEVPRNACVSLRFDDCLLNTNDVKLILADLVKVVTGYPPLTPYTARVIFDENHGANAGGSYRPTRVLIDMTIGLSEAGGLPPNAVGLPGSVGTSSSPNVSIDIPSRTDIGSSQNRVLTNVSGVSLDEDDNGPVDLNSPTVDVVRAFRSGHSTAPSEFNGFLKDQIPPR